MFCIKISIYITAWQRCSNSCMSSWVCLLDVRGVVCCPTAFPILAARAEIRSYCLLCVAGGKEVGGSVDKGKEHMKKVFQGSCLRRGGKSMHYVWVAECQHFSKPVSLEHL